MAKVKRKAKPLATPLEAVSDYDEIEGYDLSIARGVLPFIENALRRDELHLREPEENPETSFECEASLALYFILQNGEPGDRLRALKILSHHNCLSIGADLSRALEDTVGFAGELTFAALNAYEWQNFDDGDHLLLVAALFEGLASWTRFTDWLALKLMNPAWIESRQVVNQLKKVLSDRILFEEDPRPDACWSPSPAGMLLWALTDSRVKLREIGLLNQLRGMTRQSAKSKRKNFAKTLLAFSAVKSLGGKELFEIVDDEGRQFLPHNAEEWGNCLQQAAVAETIGRLGLKEYIPSLVAAHIGGIPLVEISVAAAMIRLDENIEDWTELLIRGLRHQGDGNIQGTALRAVRDLCYDLGQREQVSRDQAWAKQQLEKALPPL